MSILKNHLPERGEILYAFGGVVFAIYSWSIRGFLYQLSSLRMYHTVGEIFGIFSYLMAFALFESLLIMGCLIIAGVVLPRQWFREGFAYKGFIATLVASSAMIGLQYYLFSLHYAMPPMKVIYLGVTIAIMLLVALIILSQKVSQLPKLLLGVEERLQIFVYLYVPLGLLGLIVVILRTI